MSLKQIKPASTPDAAALVAPGDLDGITIFRYLHIVRERASGGIEQQLRLLNRGLLERHRLTILQTHLIRKGALASVEIEDIGNGRIVWVPAYAHEVESLASGLFPRARFVLEKSFSLHRCVGCGFATAIARSAASLLHHQGGHLRYRFAVLSDHLEVALQQRRVDLLLMHWMSYDADRLIRHGQRLGIPFAIVNHFDNRRFQLPAMKKWAAKAVGVASVSAHGLPNELADRCRNLSDAIDTDVFKERNGNPDFPEGRSILLHPARIQIDKGHRDVVLAAKKLRARGLDFAVCFVGAVDSPAVRNEIDDLIKAAGLQSDITILGEKSQSEIRDLLAKSSVVLLPSSSEGLPRVLLEAQAMGRPVVAYDVGGVKDTFLPNESGYLVAAGDVDGLAARIEVLLRNERLRKEFGESGRRHVVGQFSPAALVERHEQFYRNALSGRFRNELNQNYLPL